MKPVIFLLILILKAAFLAIPEKAGIFHFWIMDGGIEKKTFVWFLGDFIPMVALSFLSIFGDKSWRITSIVFTFCMVFDTFDFLCTGDQVWGHWGDFPVCANTLVIGIFGLGLIYEIWKTKSSMRIS